jgi:hypothetical protein
MRRAAALWLLLFAAYAATLGLRAFDASDYGGHEPHHLLAAESIVEDGNPDLVDEYAERQYDEFHPRTLEPAGSRTEGRLHEPYGAGFALLIAPAYALAGPVGVELFLAALAALAPALAYRLALRVVPDPWALGAALAAGLSPPFLAYGSAVYPELCAGAALSGAALLALRLRDAPGRLDAFLCFSLLGALPWLGTRFVPAGVVIGVFAARALFDARRRTLAVGSVEVALFSVALFVGVNEALYGGPTPHSAGEPGEGPTGASSPGGYLERSFRLAALFIDRDYGLLRWAPVFALAFGGLWLLWRSEREHLARAVPGVRGRQHAARLCAAVLGAQLLAAAFLAPTMFGDWFPARQLLAALPLAVPLVAWGMRHAPRLGSVLAALTAGASLWLYLDVRLGGGALLSDRPDAPFGPLTRLLPRFDDGGQWPFWLAGALGIALALLVARELRLARSTVAASG